MERDGSLPHSKQPATCPSHGPIQFSPYNIPLLEIHFNVNLPSSRKYYECSSSISCPHQKPVCTSPVPLTRHKTCPSPSWFHDPLRPKFIPQHSILEFPQRMFFNVSDEVSYQYKTAGKIVYKYNIPNIFQTAFIVAVCALLFLLRQNDHRNTR